MTRDLNSTFSGDLGGLPIDALLPERPALIGEFSSAYEAFREATIADLAPVTKYEYLQALQLADLNWAILQAKASADVELSTGTERTVRAQLNAKLAGVDPRLVLSAQLLNNSGFRRHSEKLPDLEKRARLLSAEYREIQKAPPIDVVPVSGY
ncbi:hypothetical protein OAH73_00555 [Planktomarina sp.]|nr:hypothetical protein [Planktomarina sp.]MDB4841064.1 hypothetical protein [Planktomarina sp.]